MGATAFRDLKAAFEGQDVPADLVDHGKARTAFDQGQVVMLISSTSQMGTSTKAGINWDVVTLPQSPTHPGYGWGADGNFGFVSSTSTNKDDAFRVLEVILSPGVQAEMSKNQIFSPLTDKKIQAVFGSNVPEIKGKNTAAFLL